MSWAKTIYYLFLSLAFIASFRAYKQPKYILFIPLLAAGLAYEILNDTLPETIEIDKVKDSYIAALYIALEYSFLSLIISNFIRSRWKKQLIRYSILVLVPIFVLIRFTVALTCRTYEYLDIMIEAPFLCLWTIFYLFETALHDEEFEIASNPMFWISLGNLLFFSGSFFSYGFGSYMAANKDYDTAEKLYWIARGLNILLYILYFIGFLCLRKKSQYTPS